MHFLIENGLVRFIVTKYNFSKSNLYRLALLKKCFLQNKELFNDSKIITKFLNHLNYIILTILTFIQQITITFEDENSNFIVLRSFSRKLRHQNLFFAKILADIMIRFLLKNWKIAIANRYHQYYNLYLLKPKYVHSSFSLYMNYQINKWGIIVSNMRLLQKIKKILILKALLINKKKTKSNLTFLLIRMSKNIK
ncbi:hypothetical protein BNATCHR379 (nucleomorph) [Bigelowiella natans]|uniref:Uncharacterized protein n=1 Tax=Bigelowiella natans TaxID=227086 RepID=Q3LVW4_BIGNA|nr:hypothetical protein BNATCHR379 [Bigelowiella natans]ABA27401.1 hypothetical protein [Bigelowiella natans]